jgi:AcrR family transcriptional regulator
MDVALELFDKRGFERATVSEIAEKARVSKVPIYNSLRTKTTRAELLSRAYWTIALSGTTRSFKRK